MHWFIFTTTAFIHSSSTSIVLQHYLTVTIESNVYCIAIHLVLDRPNRYADIIVACSYKATLKKVIDDMSYMKSVSQAIIKTNFKN